MFNKMYTECKQKVLQFAMQNADTRSFYLGSNAFYFNLLSFCLHFALQNGSEIKVKEYLFACY